MKSNNGYKIQFFLSCIIYLLIIYNIINLIINTYQPLPWVDEWNTISSFKNWKENGDLFNILIVPHNEHRMIFPKIIYFLDYLIFEGSAISTLAVSIFFFILISFFFFI
jgi:hypothetical protein